MASYLDNINRLQELERERIQRALGATSTPTPVYGPVADSASENKKNKGGFIGGVGYVGEKIASGLVSSIEGVWDFAAGGLADLFGADRWAEKQIANDWFGDWYDTAGSWYNAGKGMQTVGDIASGIGTSIPALGASIAGAFVGAPWLGAALTFGVASTSAGGSAVREAYKESGDLTGKEWGYAALSGSTEGLLETATNAIGMGTGAIVKSFGKNAAKNVAKQGLIKSAAITAGKSFSGEAFEEGMSAILNPQYAKLTYNPDAQDATAQEILYSAFVGGMAGVVMGEASLIGTEVGNYNSAKKIIENKTDHEVFTLAEALIARDDTDPIDTDVMKDVRGAYQQLTESLKQTDGKYVDGRQIQLLGRLNALTAAATLNEATVASAAHALNNAEAVAESLNALGYVDANGKKITYTADQIRDGFKADGAGKRFAVQKAIKNNPILRAIASTDAASHLLMDTNAFEAQAMSGRLVQSQKELNDYIEQAPEAVKNELARTLGIDDWNTLNYTEFNAKLSAFLGNAEGRKMFESRMAKKIAFESERKAKSHIVKKASAYAARKDGIRKYKVNGIEFAVEKSGEEYTLYDYTDKAISKPMSLTELRERLSEYDAKNAQEGAEKASPASDTNKAKTDEKPNESAEKENTATKKEAGAKSNVARSYEIAKNKVLKYKDLSANDQSMVRKIIRQGLALGVREDVIVYAANIAARTHTDAVFNKDMCAVPTKDGKYIRGYANGAYIASEKRFYFNPEAQTTDGFIIHELDHALRKRVGKDGAVTTKIYGDAIVAAGQDTYEDVAKRYEIKRDEVKPGDKFKLNGERLYEKVNKLEDEVEAFYAETVLKDKDVLKYLLAEKPTIKQRILNFFKGAVSDYASLPELDADAKKYFKQYEKRFAEFEKDQRGTQINTRFGYARGDVRYSFSSISQSFFGDPNITAKDFESRDYKKTDGYKAFVDKSLDNMLKTHAGFNDVKARAEIEKSIDGIVRVAIAAKKAGYDILDRDDMRDKKDSKGRLLFSSLEPNSDYFTSHDLSTICDKRLTFTEIYDEIVRREEAMGAKKGKRFFDNINNFFVLHDIMADKGMTTPCRQCYVDSMRKNLAPMARKFIQLVQETNPNNKKNDQLFTPKGEVKVGNSTLREKVLEELKNNGLEPSFFTVENLTTENGLVDLRLHYPLLYEAFNSFYGQSKPKMPKEAVPYRFGELTAMLKDHNGKIKTETIKKINSTGGFRLQSYSDFQIKNYVDVLQVIFEAGTLGLSGHAYTKVPAFLDATEGTNLKRNISIFTYKDGAEWKIDRADSFPALLDAIYDIVKADDTGNTSIIVVSQNDLNSAWIMANDNVGYGIPYHKSGNKMSTVRDTIVRENGREIKGYSDIIDHTRFQSETWKHTTSDHKANTSVKKPINIYEFWDFKNTRLSKNGLIRKNLKAYIDHCEEAGYNPKFVRYLQGGKVLTDTLKYAKEMGFVSQNATVDDISFKYKGYTIPYGYYKFLGDFGMFTPDGKVSPPKTLSLANYDFDKAVRFFDDAETLRRNEILQQFVNGTERDTLRNSDLTTEQLADLLRVRRGEVVSDVMNRHYGKSGDVSYSLTDTSNDDAWLDALTIDDLIAELGEDFDLVAYATDHDSFYSSSIDDISEETKVEPEKIKILVHRLGLANTYVDDKHRAVMKQSRLDEAIKDSGSTNPTYARRYITEISTKDFIDLTVLQKHTDREAFDTEVRGDYGGTMSDYDYKAALKDSRTPYMEVELTTGRVTGHNGRHRIRALEMAGIKSVEIELALYDDGDLVKYGAKTIPDLAISSQFDTEIETHLYNIIPLNESHRTEIERSYGVKAHADAGVSYSLPNDMNLDESVDTYTEEQYNSFGWARHAEALTKSELDDLYSKLQEKKILRRFKQSAKGEAIVEINDKPRTTLGVDNVFVFVKGKATKPEITRVVRFNTETETEMQIIKEALYERGTWSDSYLPYYEREGFTKEYRRESFGTFEQYKQEARRRSSRQTSRGVDQDNRLGNVGGRDSKGSARSPLTPLVKTFTDVAGRERNVLQFGDHYRIEGDMRSAAQPTPEAAIQAENARIIRRYAAKTDRTQTWVKKKLAADSDFLARELERGVSFSLPDTDGTPILDENGKPITYESYVDQGVPYAKSPEMTVGEMRKHIANTTHYKVFSKSRILEDVKNFPMGDLLKAETREKIADSIWQSFNSFTSAEETDSYIRDMARYILSASMREAKVARQASEEAQRWFSSMHPYVQGLTFTKSDLEEIRTVRGADGLKKVLGRWGFKTRKDGKNHRTPMDVFVTDMAREVGEFGNLEDMHPVDAFLALDEAYEKAKADINDKWQSAYEDATDADLEGILAIIEIDLRTAYEDLGDKSKFFNTFEPKLKRAKERADKWKAEYDKQNRYTRLAGIVEYKAKELKDLKKHKFANATQIHQDTLDASIGKISNVLYKGILSVGKARKAFAELLMLYRSDDFKKSVLLYENDDNPGLYNGMIETYLEVLADGNMNLLKSLNMFDGVDEEYRQSVNKAKGFTAHELKLMEGVLSYFIQFYKSYGKVYHRGKMVDIDPLANKFVGIAQGNQGLKKNLLLRTVAGRWYADMFMDAASLMRMADGYLDGFNTTMLEDLREAKIKATIEEMRVMKQYDEFVEKNKKYMSEESKKTVTVRGATMTKAVLLDLYCTTFRKQAWEGLAFNGFTFVDAKGDTVRVRGNLDENSEYSEKEIEEEVVRLRNEVEQHLTEKDREYIKIVEHIYNVESKRLKMNRDIERFGFSNVEEGYYYPIKRGDIAKNIDKASVKEELDRVSNASFNKDIVKHARQKLVLEPVDSRLRRHVTAVCQYAHVSATVEAFNRLYNYDISGKPNDPVSVKTQMENVWKNMEQYWQKLIGDVQGVNTRIEGENVFSYIRGGYAVSLLSANPKVWVTQLSSFAAASGMIDISSITKGLGVASKEDIENIGRYCPLAEIRRYENTAALAQGVLDRRGVQMGKGGRAMQATRKIGELGMKPIEKMDTFVVNRLFGACMLEVAKNNGPKLKTEANKIAAGKLLTKLILETQQNAMATERSAAMRSSNEILRTATMFSSDAMKVVGRFIDGWGEVRVLKQRIAAEQDADTKAEYENKLKLAKKKFKKALGALLLSSAYMAGIAALFKLLYNKWDKEWEEDEAKALTVTKSMTADFLGNMIGGLPVLRDAYTSLVEGYDVDNYAYSAINDFLTSAKSLKNLVDKDTTSEDIAKALKDLAYNTSSITGLPVRNVYNTLYGVTKRLSEPTAHKIDSVFYAQNYESDLNKYLDEGDSKMVEYTISLLYGGDSSTLSESTFDELRSLAELGYNVTPRKVSKKITVDGVEYPISDAESAQIRTKYFDYLESLDRLTASETYKKLTDEQRYYAVDQIVDAFYDKAVSDVMGTKGARKSMLTCIGGENIAIGSALVKDITDDVNKKGEKVSGSKRKKVVAAINAMPITTEQKILMMYVKGYVPKDGDIRGVSAESAKKKLLNMIVKSNALTKEQKASLAQSCGFTVKNGKIMQ